jgi:hypothetical protein
MLFWDASFKEKHPPIEMSVGWDFGGILKWIQKAERRKAPLGAKALNCS